MGRREDGDVPSRHHHVDDRARRGGPAETGDVDELRRREVRRYWTGSERPGRSLVAALDQHADPDPGQRDQREDDLPQPHFSTHWHYQAGFGLESPRL